jgi:type I restriction enzyme R subunit
MTSVGQIEKRTQARVVALFRERLGYDYLGDRSDLEAHHNKTRVLKQGMMQELLTGRIRLV